MAGDLFRRQRLEAELQAARQDGHRQFLRIGGGEQELHMGRRLLQRLQQRVERVRGEHVHFVDQIDLVAATAGRVLHVFQQLTGILHLGAAGGIHLDQIDKTAFADFLTGGTNAARAAADAFLAIEAAGQDAGDGGLANTPGTGEQIGVVQAILIERVHQRPGNVFLAHQFIEGARAILAGKNLVTHGTPAKRMRASQKR